MLKLLCGFCPLTGPWLIDLSISYWFLVILCIFWILIPYHIFVTYPSSDSHLHISTHTYNLIINIKKRTYVSFHPKVKKLNIVNTLKFPACPLPSHSSIFITPPPTPDNNYPSFLIMISLLFFIVLVYMNASSNNYIYIKFYMNTVLLDVFFYNLCLWDSSVPLYIAVTHLLHCCLVFHWKSI